mgnify:FL=1
MDGFKRPNRHAPANYDGDAPLNTSPPVPQQAYSQNTVPPAPAQPSGTPVIAQNTTPLDITLSGAESLEKLKKHHIFRNVMIVMLALLMIAAGAAYWWYQDSMQPLNTNDTTGKDVTIQKGATIGAIAADLQQKGLIKNQYGLQLYARFTGQTSIVEGNCIIKASENVSQILDKLAKGCNDFKSITFYPGATIEKPLYKPPSADFEQNMYVKYVLGKAGFSDQQIQQALNKQYTGPLFAGKPAGTTLEGYIYGETYHIDTAASVERVLQMTFDQMYKDITANDLVNRFSAQGLNLYQGITLSSIVQRELNCEGKPTEERKQRCYGYQQTIAQVFLKRLREGVTLGSDVTFIYAADMAGVAPTVGLDSPYNTRIKPGLPPGPIASPGLLAMKAVGDPTATDYNFFIAGDDGLIYFARTLREHEANIAQYCQKLCNEL